MPGWGEIIREIGESAANNGGNPDFDLVRRKYLAQLYEHTGRNTVLYATDFLGGGQASPANTSITLLDMQGLMECFRGLPGPNLDLILHSPGGSPEAANSLVHYMRSKYPSVRVFVPLAAMSAATMWALSANEIVMGKHSQLGPIDPQLVTAGTAMPARALIRQFERAAEECTRDPERLSVWMPILQQYAPGLLEVCAQYEELGRELVCEWLKSYMFADDPDREAKSLEIARFFADADLHKAHGRGIDRDLARSQGLVVTDLEDDQVLQDLVLSVFHATTHTFTGTGTIKIIENHAGRAFVIHQPTQVNITQMMPPLGIVPPPAGVG
ncbi:SDH family Clp fold serine proteinase [Streptomyces sp. NPDC004012]